MEPVSLGFLVVDQIPAVDKRRGLVDADLQIGHGGVPEQARIGVVDVLVPVSSEHRVATDSSRVRRRIWVAFPALLGRKHPSDGRSGGLGAHRSSQRRYTALVTQSEGESSQ